MKPNRHAATFALLLAVALTHAQAARAGGNPDVTTDDDDPRTSVFGFVKDNDGDPIDNAEVTITMQQLKTDLFVHSDPQGHFATKLFYNPVDPKDITVACAKTGYQPMAVVPRPPLGTGAPIEFDCVLEKK